MLRNDEEKPIAYGRVTTPREVGALCRQERVRRGLTLSQMYEATALSTRFLSEFERGKEHASLGRALLALSSLGLDVVVLPRGRARRLMQLLAREDEHEQSKP